MGPPGGGRNDITSRFSRHLQIVSIDEFDDDTMSRIFNTISDWHFGSNFDGCFVRLGKVSGPSGGMEKKGGWRIRGILTVLIVLEGSLT